MGHRSLFSTPPGDKEAIGEQQFFSKRSALNNARATRGHYHTELHEAEAPPDIQSLSRQDEIAIEIELNEMQ